MNNLYTFILWCLLFGSCQTDYDKKQATTTKIELMYPSLDFNDIYFYPDEDLNVDTLISNSIYFSAVFDYYSCTVKSTSSPMIYVHYENQYLYLMSKPYRFSDCHLLEYSDIDDLEVTITRPQFDVGTYMQFSMIRVPINSHIECIFEMSIILNYHVHSGETNDLK